MKDLSCRTDNWQGLLVFYRLVRPPCCRLSVAVYNNFDDHICQ